MALLVKVFFNTKATAYTHSMCLVVRGSLSQDQLAWLTYHLDVEDSWGAEEDKDREERGGEQLLPMTQ